MSLKTYILRRILQVIPLIFGVIMINFTIIHLAPGDIALMLAGEDASPEYVETLRTRFGLDKPIHEQLLIYISNVVRGDLGYSFANRSPVVKCILERVPATVLLIFCSMLFSITVGVLLGVNASKRPYSRADNATTIGSLLGYSIPNFWLGMILMLVFSLSLGIFPVQGMFTVGVDMVGLERWIDIARHIVLPALVLGTSQVALYARLTRASMLDVLDQDYIITARAKGCNDRAVIFDHALKNALLPVVTMIGLNLGFVLTGATLTETVFAWPGIGRLMYDSIFRRDYPVLMGIFIIVSISVILASLLTDIIYAYLDPRIRYE